MEPIWMISAFAVLIVLLLVLGAPLKPVKFVGQGIVKLLIGALLLFFLNALGNQYGIHVPINLATVTVSGFLGVPGMCALVAIQSYVI
ncbi:inhibitor of the pro-sigma K processing machinery [Cytobacillus horneckiae]|uniref:Pro-sigmaK processing inhibitor BofA n=1 Tax=Cytobacillus horneckiae TaxID=549687 RepID=A0A2N0Z8J9_9BACI|nr:pro-sigmaK processing inhibitor BofA family protein [Cytobacillus horneckiae]NRG46349.1 pro-sigmaK processing inhibitor BofA family protein [Bacillus sp. CRN 9]MBN6890018.1 pro-sigmaK processing inhibitor BofA family protein [Cytobacillus horneckiae]MCM3181234.1 pro-sigmaK processing inhibitor BofA family protein [Cytobacillus horneckiae]MEC1159254.1 pro-sigmaK processing inhibitor BofA family protein [Cytobacillus horneckiae]MED2936496.1 pro-sigmaK processing inhibitor BofA family protein 